MPNEETQIDVIVGELMDQRKCLLLSMEEGFQAKQRRPKACDIEIGHVNKHQSHSLFHSRRLTCRTAGQRPCSSGSAAVTMTIMAHADFAGAMRTKANQTYLRRLLPSIAQVHQGA